VLLPILTLNRIKLSSPLSLLQIFFKLLPSLPSQVVWREGDSGLKTRERLQRYAMGKCFEFWVNFVQFARLLVCSSDFVGFPLLISS
jgi:hypothetical protein